MDVTKAQRLLVKIQAMLDQENGNELSRLEKDLIKSYIIQLYDALASDEVITHPDIARQVEVQLPKQHRTDEPPVYIPETPRTEPSKPVFEEKTNLNIQEIPFEIKKPAPEPVTVVQKPEAKPFQIPKREPVRETLQMSKSTPFPSEDSESLEKLFELPKTEEMSGRISHVPIPSIESAMGLNERIFTLNELFGGDKGLFDATCSKLNEFQTFSEARFMLLNGPARQFNWIDPQRIKMAEQFIRIVVRRYPKA